MKIKLILSLLCFMMLSFVLKSQTLDSLLIKAYNNNPELKALQLQYEAALKKAPQVKQLPDPTVGVGVPALRPETRLGAQVLSISASQMFPWFGTLKAKEDVVLTMAKSKYEQVAAERLNIDYQIKTAYFNLYLLQKQQDVIYKDIRIFETLEKVALAKVESGKSLASDVLTVRIKLEELNNKIQILEEQKQYFTAAINEAVNNPASTIILLDTTTVSFADLHYDLEQFKQNIQDNHPLINQLDWNIEASNKELALNAKDRMPSIGLGLDYSMVAKRTDANPQYNGRDILIPKVVVAIPLYQKNIPLKPKEKNLNKRHITCKRKV